MKANTDVYVLYLDDNEKYNAEMKINNTILNKYNIIFWKGFNGNSKSNSIIYKKYLNNALKNKSNKILLTKGQFGHVQSMISILKNSIKNNNNILFFEHDIYFDSDFSNKLNTYLSLNCDLLFLGSSQDTYFTEKTWNNINILDLNDKYQYYKPYKTLGTFGLYMNIPFMISYLKELEKFNFPSDIAIINIYDNFTSFVCYPNIVCCNVVQSKTSSNTKRFKQIDKIKDYQWFNDYSFNDYYFLKKGKYSFSIDSIIGNNSYISYLSKKIYCDNDENIVNIVLHSDTTIHTNNLFIHNIKKINQ